MTARILIADDDEVSCQLFAEVLEKEGYQVDRAQNGEATLSLLDDQLHDMLIIDVRMPGMTGLDVTRIVHEKYSSLPIVVMTAFGSMETAVEAIHEGAFDFISKPMNLEELKKAVSRALAQRSLRGRKREGEEEIEEGERSGTIIGKSPAMVEVYKTVARAAPSRSTVLVLGESGTGKELIARAIHQHSPRAGHPFVAVDCGALTETLLESELFGHMRGAFTGAVTDKKGVFEEAEGGTCFLDEIGDVSRNMQAKLLRVLQEHEVRRVGGKDWLKVDVRVVAATNRNLAELVRTGAFRQDLYYRLNVVAIHLPPLRERLEDIPLLVRHFLNRYSQESEKSITAVSDKAMDLLCTYPWPGNIRELENTIEQAVALSSQQILTPDDLPVEVRDPAASNSFQNSSQDEQFLFPDTPTLEEVKKRYVLHVLSRNQGNISRTAKILNIDRRSLYRMLARYKIEPFINDQ
ncbi:MAG TPA: sigma-54 dependent transcriptional regulator [Candidatus Binatia bacterium]|jgi:DNA-binding NtrC family response regulator|nr:sigma-54 dependent transcriptional regulator [Candidatus Binatia bacterium]